MNRNSRFHRYERCDDCELWWRQSGRQTVGFAEFERGVRCPECR